MDVRRHKPLWGFGPIGWVALAILTAFVVALARGWDLPHAYAVLIWRFSSEDLGNWAKIYVALWAFPALMMMRVTFGLWGLMYAGVAFFIYPRKLPVLPIVLLPIVVAVEVFGFAAAPRGSSWFPFMMDNVLSTLAAAAEFGLILWITRRWWCAAPLIIPLLWNAGVEPRLSTAIAPAWFDHQYVVICAHVAMAVPLLLWAITARLTPAPPGKPCPNCDYDLTGLAEPALCPECGRAPAPPAAA